MKKITPDKWRHFFTGIAMGLVLQGVMVYVFTDKNLLASIITFVMVVVIAYGFELFSKVTGKGHYDIVDAIASIIGGIVGIGIMFLF